MSRSYWAWRLSQNLGVVPKSRPHIVTMLYPAPGRHDVGWFVRAAEGATLSVFHPDLKLAPFLPRAVIGPRTFRLVRLGTRLQRGARDVELVEVAAGVRARIHRPPVGRRASGAGVLYVHGGGYVIGTPELGDPFCARLAEHLEVVVAAVDYRLAPEHPYPTPLQDVHAALRWLAEQPDVDAERIAVVGDSAGGGLAAALSLLVRDLGEVRPALQVLSYPMLDDRTSGGGVDPRVLRMWNQHSNRFGWNAYLGDLAAGKVPATAAPARADDLTGLPATWIGVGTNDLFYAENLAWARGLRAAGVPCELFVVEGAYHGFDGVEPRAAVSRDFLRARIGALRDALTDRA
jgi:acetyl esterase/lipase